MLVTLVAIVSCEPALAKSNCVAEYLSGAERQYETPDQGEEVRRALKDMLSIKSSLLLKKRYSDYQMKRNRWTAIDVLHRYFVPTNAKRSLNSKCFLLSVKTPTSRQAIRKQLDELSTDLAAKNPQTPQEAPLPVVVSTTGSPSAQKREDRLFDNTSMNNALKKALDLYSKSDNVGAEKAWRSVIEFMHGPRWFPTAAMVPICLNFAKLADICIDKKKIEDAHELMRASFEFPFHVKAEEEEIDAVAFKLIESEKKIGKAESAKSFLEFAISKMPPVRRPKYQAWLDGL